MKKILFTAINARYSHSNPAIYYFKADIDRDAYTPLVREFSINQPVDEITEEIVKTDPHITAISVYIWNSNTVKLLIPKIKAALPGTVIILGGPEVSYNADEWITEFPQADIIIAGPGEEGMKFALSNINGNRNKTLRIPNRPFESVPFPYSDEDLAALKNRYVYYESSRGCPFRCSYCLSSRSDQRLEFLPIERVKRDILHIMKYSPGTLKFVDRTFNIKPAHSREIWKFLISEFSKNKTTFHFEIHPALLTDDDFEIIEKAPHDLFQFEMGIQSTCKKALEAVNRKDTWEKSKAAVKRIVDMGNIHIHTDLIAGLPFEDWQTLKKSFNDIYSLGADHFQAGILKVLKGTEIYDRAEEFGMEWDEEAPFTIQKNLWIDRGNFSLFENMAALVDIIHNTHQFDTALKILESLSDSPFDIYEKMAGLSNQELNRAFETGAELILEFAKNHYSDKINIIRDALRWDFCLKQKNHRYPNLLKSEQTDRARVRGFSHVVKFSEKNIIRFNGREFSQADLKKSIFFQSETETFRRNFLKGHNTALFLPSKEVIIFSVYF